MTMRPVTYESTSSLEAVVSAIGNEVRPLAGGTDLLTLMKANLVTPQELVDIKRLGDLPGGIQETAQGVTLGALTTLAEITPVG